MSGRVLITGAAGALGRSVVQRFLDGGDRVLAVDANEGALGELLRMVESLAREMAPFGGRANAILPGTMDTPANRAAMPDADPSQWVTTDAVASAIHFLTTPAAAGITGAAVRVPGRTL